MLILERSHQEVGNQEDTLAGLELIKAKYDDKMGILNSSFGKITKSIS